MSDTENINQNKTYKYNFTIYRSHWYRGNGSQKSALLRDDSTKCCVGFYCEQILGATHADILNRALIVEITDRLQIVNESITGNNACDFEFSSEGQSIYLLNDWIIDTFPREVGYPYYSKIVDEAHREELITKFFNSKGIGVTFVD